MCLDLKQGFCLGKKLNSLSEVCFRLKKKLFLVLLLVFLFLLPIGGSGSVLTTVEYDYIYEKLSRQVPVYAQVCIPIFDSKNLSHTEDCITNLDYYKTEYYDGKRIGVDVGGKNYNTPNLNVNAEEGYLYICDVAVGDRNWKEFPMRQFEIDKGVCRKIDLLK